MTAGLPGLGISGIFYLCLVLIMPIRELYLTARGRTSVERWKQVGFQWMMALLMTLAVQAQFLAMRAGVRWLAATDTSFGEWISTKIIDRPLMPQILLGMGITLALVLAMCAGTSMAYLAQRAGLIQQTVGE